MKNQFRDKNLLRAAGFTLTGISALVSVACTPPSTEDAIVTPQIVQETFNTITAKLFDQLEGIGFVTESGQSGFTNTLGELRLKPEEQVTFFIGSPDNKVELAKAQANSLIKLSDLKPVNSQTNNKDFTRNLMSFLTALDHDNDQRNSISLSDTAHSEAAKRVKENGWSIDFNVPKEAFYDTSGLASYLTAQGRSMDDLDAYWSSLRKSRSSSIAITSNDRRLVVVNRQNDSVSIIEVIDAAGNDVYKTIAEVTVGKDPHSVVISPDDKWAYVTNSVSGTVSVIDLNYYNAFDEIKVGSEPRGIVISPNGEYVMVANHTAGSVSIIHTSNRQVSQTVVTGGNPFALTMSNDGDSSDTDETVYVTRFFGEVIDASIPDGFNNAKHGVIDQFTMEQALNGKIAANPLFLSPLDSGFSADRRQFCQLTREAQQLAGDVIFFGSGVDGSGNGSAALANDTFCSDASSNDISDEGPIAKTKQDVYPNQLYAALLRQNRLYIPNIGASPEPPVKFNVNVQALIGVINTQTGADQASINLNNQIKQELQPDNPQQSLARLFGNDVVAIDADRMGENFLVVSRGGNYVLSLSLDDTGRLSINAPNDVVRYQTGNLPSGIVMSFDGKRAYTNNEVNTSITAIDLVSQTVIKRDIASSATPTPGTQKHRNIVGKLAFFTALGIPDSGLFNTDVRDIEPLQFRGKASDNGWSGCGSCHPDGHSDNVTWIFPTGPRQTIALEGTFAKGDLTDQRILNWNGVRGSVTDFNNNSRGVQGGIGHATNVFGENRTAQIFNHGPTDNISEALDAMTEWVANAVRSPIMPPPSDIANWENGQAIFAQTCADCHGGTKWTKSRTAPVYTNNPTFASNPLAANFFAAGKQPPLDSRVKAGGPQIINVTDENLGTLSFLDKVGTLNANSALEIRGAGAIGGGIIDIAGDINEGLEVAKQSTQGFKSLGGAGFNTPSLLGVAYHAPYLHDGSALTLKEVYQKHTLPDNNDAIQDASIASLHTKAELDNLTVFLRSIDDDTPILPSATDAFVTKQ